MIEVKPSIERVDIDNPASLVSIQKHVEKCGRVCYKSEHNITDNSFIPFIEMLKKKEHLSVLEHGTVYLTMPLDKNTLNFFSTNKYSRVVILGSELCITTNLRVIYENDLEKILSYITAPCCHIKRETYNIVCSRVISQQFMRHRVFSFSQESQRFCNYNNEGKFGEDIYFIENRASKSPKYQAFLKSCEVLYKDLVKSGVKAEDARFVLPNSVKTEFYMTGFVDDWQDFKRKRTIPHAQEEIRKLAMQI